MSNNKNAIIGDEKIHSRYSKDDRAAAAAGPTAYETPVRANIRSFQAKKGHIMHISPSSFSHRKHNFAYSPGFVSQAMVSFTTDGVIGPPATT